MRLSQVAVVDGLVLIATPGRSMGDIVIEQLKNAGSSSAVVSTARDILTRLMARQPVGAVPSSLRALFRPGVYPFWRSALAFEAPGALASFEKPVLLIFGGRDLQVTPFDHELFVTAKPGVATRTFATMNHVLRSSSAAREENLALYGKPDTPLQPGLSDSIADFLSYNGNPN